MKAEGEDMVWDDDMVYLNTPPYFLTAYLPTFSSSSDRLTLRAMQVPVVCLPTRENFSRLDTAAPSSTTQGLFPESHRAGRGGGWQRIGRSGSCLFFAFDEEGSPG